MREFLQQYTTLKFFMKVNVYDPANIQKGRLMLLNLAEDLKDLAKIKVSPSDVTAMETAGESEKKPKSVEAVQKKAKTQFVSSEQIKKTELIDDYDKDFYEDIDDRAQYLYMELESTFQ